MSLDFKAANRFNRLPADSLDAWLLERYRLFVEASNGQMLTAGVQHIPWQVAAVELQHYDDSLSQSHGMPLEKHPALAHFSPGLIAQFNAFQFATKLNPCDDRRRLPCQTAMLRTAPSGIEESSLRLR